jgi:hypothetical protein
MLTVDQKDNLDSRDPHNIQVLQPYITGRDINQRPDCSAARWVINFRDWTLERAEQFPDCMEIVHRLVKPEREQKKAADYRKYWWRYGRRGAALYDAIDDLDFVIAIAQTSSTIMPVKSAANQVFAHKCVVFAVESYAALALLSSIAHSAWVMRYSSTIRVDISYTPTDVFLTWPRPKLTTELEALGRQPR